MAIVGRPLFGSRYLRSAMNVQFHARPRFMNHPSWSHITTTIRVITSDTTTFRVTPSQVWQWVVNRTQIHSRYMQIASALSQNGGYLTCLTSIYRFPFRKCATIRFGRRTLVSIKFNYHISSGLGLYHIYPMNSPSPHYNSSASKCRGVRGHEGS